MWNRNQRGIIVMEDKEIIIKDFSKIAQLGEKKWDHNSYYHKFLLKHLPKQCERVLDIGCGIGEFSRLLSEKSKQVEGIDLTPEMISRAKELSTDFRNIDFKVEDVMEQDFDEDKYDCIASIATMHHLPFEEILNKVKISLKPGGVFMILDLYEQKTLGEKLSNLIAVPTNIICMLIKAGRLKASEEERRVWEEHGKNDRYMTISDIEKIANKVLPGVKVKRHFFWRYSLIWKK